MLSSIGVSQKACVRSVGHQETQSPFKPCLRAGIIARMRCAASAVLLYYTVRYCQTVCVTALPNSVCDCSTKQCDTTLPNGVTLL